MWRKRAVILGIILIFIIGGFLIRRQIIINRNQSRPLEVTPRMVMSVKEGELKKTVSASGYLQPVRERELKFTLGGELVDVRVKEGSRVAAGELLMQLDNKEQELNLIKTANAYESARINQSASQIRELELNLEIARERLKATSLKAPFAGLISQITVKEGDYAAGNQIVGRLIDDSGYKIEVAVDESDSRQLKTGQPVRVTLEALPGEEFGGEVSEIGYQTSINNGVVTLPVTVLLEQSGDYFKPGFTAEVEITVESVKDKLLVPVTAVFTREGQTRVVRVVDGKAEPVRVETGSSNGIETVIEEGLAAGDRILINVHNFADPQSGQNRILFEMRDHGRGDDS